ncbi:hypothetical protein [Nonomuraea longicatena]|uniref:Uncharacterized protein n=1 Tax=Nonomuraea longicatena TaxID=83682 RepID=A0ABN1PYH3_9ACTN
MLLMYHGYAQAGSAVARSVGGGGWVINDRPHQLFTLSAAMTHIHSAWLTESRIGAGPSGIWLEIHLPPSPGRPPIG